MAFSLSLDRRISVGARKGMVFTVTDAQTTGSTGKTELRKCTRYMAVNTTDNADHFKELEVVATQGSIVLTSGTADDDGKLMVLGF